MQLAAIGIQELWPILLLLLLLFYANRIPELFRGVGEGMKEFKKAAREMTEEDKAPALETRESVPAANESTDSRSSKGKV
jgi:sec-independent protein translocase protein TatA